MVYDKTCVQIMGHMMWTNDGEIITQTRVLTL